MSVTTASSAAQNRGWYKRNEIAITPWLFLTPAILFFAVYVIIPIGQSFWISFHEWDGLGEKRPCLLLVLSAQRGPAQRDLDDAGL